MKKKRLVVDLDNTVVDTHGTGLLYPDVEKTLEILRQTCILFLLTMGVEDEQHRKLEQCGIEDVFEDVIVVKTNEDKLDVLREIADVASREGAVVVVVGDRTDVELFYGNQLGLVTVRVSRPGGKYAGMEPRSHHQHPTHEVTSFHELLEVIEDI